jgi:hypothetical protein
MFEIVPQRTFEHKGDLVTVKSSFAIRHTLFKSYIGSNILEMDNFKNKVKGELSDSKFNKNSRTIRGLNLGGLHDDINEPLELKLESALSAGGVYKEEYENR